MRIARLLFVAFALQVSVSVIAQPARPPAGKITGAVTAEGLSLPGVTITVRGPLGVRATLTNLYGSFVIDGLAIGAVYEITAELPGFVTLKKVVALTVATASHDVTFELPVERGMQIDECIEMGPSPVEIPLMFSMTQRQASVLPLDRSLLSVVSLSPGVH
jgi:hypothetical protein